MPLAEVPVGWSAHNQPSAGLDHFYQFLLEGQAQTVYDELSLCALQSLNGEEAYLLGLSSHILGFHQQALDCFDLAEKQDFLSKFVIFNRANSLRAINSYDLALEAYQAALKIDPEFVECRHNYALALYEYEQYAQAEECMRNLLVDVPDYYKASFALGNLLRHFNRLPEACEAYRLCLQVQPAYPDALNNLGLCLAGLDQKEKAIATYRLGLTADASSDHCRQNLAQALVTVKKHDLAIEEFEKFLELPIDPMQRATGIQGLMSCYLELGLHQQAFAFAESLEDKRLQTMVSLYILPIVYESEHDVNQWRSRYNDVLDLLLDQLDGFSQDDPVYEDIYSHCWGLTSFYLSYQMEDDLPLQIKLAEIFKRILKPRLASYMLPLEPHQGDGSKPLRVGVLSPHLRNHNGTFWALGWLDPLRDNPAYDVYAYNLGDDEDEVSQRFAALGCYRKLSLTPETAEAVVQQIRADDLDFLLIPDVGMHPASRIAASVRLARYQAVGWGHPITTGSECIDYYLSGAGMESADAASHYSERLVLLPRTGLNYPVPLSVHQGDDLRSRFELPADRPLLLSLQSTFKYHPRNDCTFVEICRRFPDALILFVAHMGHPSVSDRLYHRLKIRFADVGLDADQHLRFLHRLEYADYVAFFDIAHHSLDTIDWNGGNSSFQAFSRGCPVVSMPTAFMRGRHTLAMLEVLELPELIASSREEYVEISVRLLEDDDFANQMRALINERSQRLFADQEVSDCFVDFLAALPQEQLVN
ncbi:hypothetical protein EV13_0312 [Prochlorococcus sp. MIT 0702]|nr:hypothetical protein EV13_0312 [Prochlorococcus sp. MIT 0702]KGG36515.1 hypothetical protein EV14_0247 [Prochlorococcus sp. MIT 0703]